LSSVISTPLLILLAVSLSIYFFVHSERLTDNVIILIATFVGGWAGGRAAFSEERMTREDKEHKARISAANRALFKISIFYDQFNNIRQYYIDADNARNDEFCAMHMNSPVPGIMQDITFDLDSISYFLDAEGECGMVLKELQVLEWLYKVLVTTVDLRAKAYEELMNCVSTTIMPERTPESIRQVFFREYLKLNELTTQFVSLVDEGTQKAIEVDKKMRDALQLQFGTDDFLKVNFETKQEETAS